MVRIGVFRCAIACLVIVSNLVVPAAEVAVGTDLGVEHSEAPAGLFAIADLNSDGDVDAVDVQLVNNAAYGLGVGDINPDVNDDGAVNAIDIQLVINAALGI